MGKMAALTVDGRDTPHDAPRRGVLLRFLDVLAEWQMRHSVDVISRAQPARANSVSVDQPSSDTTRSSARPRER
jgi:hypothetical protein